MVRLRTLFLMSLTIGLIGVMSTVSHAGMTLNSIRLNSGAAWTFNSAGVVVTAGDPVSVSPGATIDVELNVTTSGSGASNDWRTVAWEISEPPGLNPLANCVGVPGGGFGAGGVHTATVQVTAPLVPDTYTGAFKTWPVFGCGPTTTQSALVYLAAAITVTGSVPTEPSTWGRIKALYR